MRNPNAARLARPPAWSLMVVAVLSAMALLPSTAVAAETSVTEASVEEVEAPADAETLPQDSATYSGTDTKENAEAAASIVNCTIYSNRPYKSGGFITGSGDQACTGRVEQELRVCVYRLRWYGWSEQGCDTSAFVFDDFHSWDETVGCAAGTYTYQTRTRGRFIDVDGRLYTGPVVVSDDFRTTC